MMATTHALVGLLLGAVAAAFAPVGGPVAVAAAVVGSVLPDADMYAGHRRTLHFPVAGPPVAAAAVGVALLAPSPFTVAVAVLLVGVALHAAMDVLGAGLELRPWEATSERAVYDHVRGRWLRPRRWVRYDGAPEDLLLAGVLGALAYPLVGGPEQALVLALLAVSTAYALLRRTLATLAGRLVALLPPDARRHVPSRYTE